MNLLRRRRIHKVVERNSQGVIYIDYLEEAKTVTAPYCAEFLGQFDADMKRKW